MILSIDQGTTNTKALVVGRDGRPVFRAGAGLGLRHPAAGFAEQDPEAIWASVVRVIGECLAAGRGVIEGVAISNQRETALAWERATGAPVAPAMSWQCRRGAGVCARLQGDGEVLRRRSGLPLDPLLSATKWAWLMERDEGLAARARGGEICFGTVDSWLVWKLTGGEVHACDHTNASRTGLLNLAAAEWDEELMGMFGVPREALPELRSSSGMFGRCVVEGLEGVPIVAAIGDSHAALAGHGVTTAGTVKATYGTGSSLMMLVEGRPETERLASTIAWSLSTGVQYALEGNISMAGAAVQWVGDFLGVGLGEALKLAAGVKDSGGVVFVPAMLGLGAPHWKTEARGLVAGLEAGSRAGNLVRAAVEAIAFQVRDVFDAMEEDGAVRLAALRADGGATGNDELMQMQADVLGRPVWRSACEDLSALGAAWLGGLTLGWWGSMGEFAGLPEAATVFEPKMGRNESEARYRGWKTVVRRALMEAE